MDQAAEVALADAVLSSDDTDLIDKSLAFVRTHLGMEVAYLSEFVGDDLVFRATDAPGFEEVVHVGGTMPLDAVYCRHILAGRLPEMMPDTSKIPFAQEIPMTKSVPIGSHVSVPIMRSDGTPYGMFCCLSRSPSPTLNDRDLDVMRAFANLSAEQVRAALEDRAKRETLKGRIDAALEGDALRIVFQPIVSIATGKTVGVEALSRFQSEPYLPPDVWFADAGEVGAATELELRSIRRALEDSAPLPESIYVSVNASPATVESGRLLDEMAAFEMGRLVLEVTEHEMPTDLEAFRREVVALRKQGVRLAIDDMGAGYSGLQQIVALQPDIIKLDMSLTTGVHTDVVRRSLAAALVNFAQETGAKIVAEGIEVEAEMACLAGLGVNYGQGYFLAKPAEIDVLFPELKVRSA
ncbi:MAG: EAL domain-containing protein [Pseudomonadota bacterium]